MKPMFPINPALAWSRVGLQWLEMLAASGTVIAHRTRRNNSPAQLFVMGSEKVQAAVESSHRMTRQMMMLQSSDPMAMWNAWARVVGSGVAPFRARAVRNARARRRRSR